MDCKSTIPGSNPGATSNTRVSGGIGIRVGLKIQWTSVCAGSSPASPTYYPRLYNEGFFIGMLINGIDRSCDRKLSKELPANYARVFLR